MCVDDLMKVRLLAPLCVAVYLYVRHRDGAFVYKNAFANHPEVNAALVLGDAKGLARITHRFPGFVHYILRGKVPFVVLCCVASSCLLFFSPAVFSCIEYCHESSCLVSCLFYLYLSCFVLCWPRLVSLALCCK